MSLVEVDGDLFDPAHAAIGHGCNLAGSMGGGVAREVRKRYPELYRRYVRDCADGTLSLGSFTTWQGPDRLVYNLGTQRRPGRDADLSAVVSSVQAALADVASRGLSSLAVPRLGAGIGGLLWSDVSLALRAVTDRSPVELVVIARPCRGLAELLAATECSDVDDLEGALNEQMEVWVHLEVHEKGLSIVAESGDAAELSYPIGVAQLWREVAELDADSQAAIEELG